MVSTHTSSTEHFAIHGTDAGARLFVVLTTIIGILVCSWLAWQQARWLWPIVTLFCCAVITFALVGKHQRSKALILFPDHLRVTSWMGERRIPLHQLAAVSLRSHLSGRFLDYGIVFWDTNNQEVGQILIRPFRNDTLQQLMTTLQSGYPHLTIDRELQHYLASPDPSFNLR